MDSILKIGNQERCALFLNQIVGKNPLLVTVIGNTETGKIPGISAAGANPNITDFTPAADIEYLYYEFCKCIQGVPVTPTGIPTPGIITKAIIDHLDFPHLTVIGGVNIFPSAPFISLGGNAGGDISTGSAVENPEKIFVNGEILGKNLSKIANYLVIGESIAGGTTTALGVLTALGYDANNKVSSSLPENPSRLKIDIVTSGLKARNLKKGDLKEDPLNAIKYFGDPMQAAVLGIISGVSGKIPVLLAGGTQMAAVLALAQNLNPNLISNVAIGTTKWIVNDESSDILNLINQINPTVPILAANFNFGDIKYEGLRVYETGMVKEGVGAGGCAIAAIMTDPKKMTIDILQKEIEKKYEHLSL
ncbi:nicotinate mononucleotide-dependent phosphoribosyltransferase CobT [Candidatus Lokiarchaeum ossiferum]|uniref:nicotinate mononucleotide-dependent phosphoribosyltransferase CobT n=1 Tax=Candidatus Lokiarchaeum ossiferum TaxID=2951803 RepID=UPI00352E07B7